MFIPLAKRGESAFSRGELVLVLAVLALLGALFYPALMFAKANSQTKICKTNLKEIALAIRRTGMDSYANYGLARSTNVGGTKEFVKGADAYQHFRAISNELGSVKLLVCPVDSRRPAISFQNLSNENLSYFVNLDADPTKPNAFLSGDRQLMSYPSRIDGMLIPGAGKKSEWNTNLHVALGQPPKGTVVLSDGSVSSYSSKALVEQFTNQYNLKVRFLFPE